MPAPRSRLGREWPDLASLAYPTAFPLLAVAAFAASFAPGVIGVVGTSFSGALLVAYVIAGLALMHFIARGRAPWLLWLVYGALLLLRSLRRPGADVGRSARARHQSQTPAGPASPSA